MTFYCSKDYMQRDKNLLKFTMALRSIEIQVKFDESINQLVSILNLNLNLIHFLPFPLWHGQILPLIILNDFSDIQDLTNVIWIMRQLPVNRIYRGERFVTDMNSF